MAFRAAFPLACLVLVTLLVGCGGDEAEAPSGFRVALLTPGSIADGGWNVGLRGPEADPRRARRRDPPRRDPYAGPVRGRLPRATARRGFDLVFGHGFEYQEAAAKVARCLPGHGLHHDLRQHRAAERGADGLRAGAGDVSLWRAGRPHDEERQARADRRRRSAVDPQHVPGVPQRAPRRRRPGVTVREVFLGNFDDMAAAREAALALLDEGADLLLHQANDAGSRRVPGGAGARRRRGARSTPSAPTATRTTWRPTW